MELGVSILVIDTSPKLSNELSSIMYMLQGTLHTGDHGLDFSCPINIDWKQTCWKKESV